MIVVFSTKTTLDFIIMTSIQFAYAKVGGPVVLYKPDLSFKGHGKIALVGHGAVGQIQGYSAASIGDHLIDPGRGVSPRIERFVVTSCHAGARDANRPGTALVEILAEKLRKTGNGGLEIVGYAGPSIKNSGLGSFAKVVNPGRLDEARKIQSATIAKHSGIGSLGADISSGNIDVNATGVAAAGSKDFYAEFIAELDKQKILLGGDDVARVAVVLD